MKKTLTINLGGTVYHIDEDAYHLLDNYLTNLRIHFRREEGAEEIVHDMELRISELFTDRLNEGKQVITLEDVEEIIARMGKPEDLSGEENGETSGSEKQRGTTARRLFRDPDNKVLGGCSLGAGRLYGMGCHLGAYHSAGSWFLYTWVYTGIHHCLDYYPHGTYGSREACHERSGHKRGEYR